MVPVHAGHADQGVEVGDSSSLIDAPSVVLLEKDIVVVGLVDLRAIMINQPADETPGMMEEEFIKLGEGDLLPNRMESTGDDVRKVLRVLSEGFAISSTRQEERNTVSNVSRL